MTPPNVWSAGHVNRWHANDCHALRNSQDTNHQHSARVAYDLGVTDKLEAIIDG